MKSTREEKTAFATVLLKTLPFYDKTLDAEQCADWYELLKGFELANIATAFNRHLTDPKHGSHCPKPADLFRHLNSASDAETHVAASLRQTAQILHHCNPVVADKAARRAEALVALPPDQRPSALAAMLRAGLAESEQRRAEERQQKRDDEAAKKATIQKLLDSEPAG